MENMENNFNQQPQQQPQPQMQPQPEPQNQSNSMAIAALVCGILGIIGSFIPVVCYFTLVLAILGIVFGAKGMKKAKETATGKGLAVAGLVLGIVGTSFSAIGVICVLCAVGVAGAASAGTSLF